MRDLFRVATFIFVVISLAAGSAFGQNAVHSAAVTFHTVDAFGNALPYEVSRFQSTSSKRELADAFRALTAASIPYGSYRYQLKRSDYPSVGWFEGTIEVNQSQVWKTHVYYGVLTVADGFIAEALLAKPIGFYIAGRVLPVPVGRPAWVRIQSAFDGNGYEVPIDEKGNFRLEELLRGAYVVLVIERTTVTFCGSLTMQPAKSTPGTLTIDISQPVPTVKFVQ